MAVSQYEVDFNGSLKNQPVRSRLYGLSTDTKPTTNVANGSEFVEMDTSTIYFYDRANSEWRAWDA